MEKGRNGILNRSTRIGLLFLLLPFATRPAQTQDNRGKLDIHVTRPDLTEGIPGVTLTLQGPYLGASGDLVAGLYKPNPNLTPEMRQQVDTLIATAPPGIAPEVVAGAAQRMEATLLGLPVPPTVPTTPAAANAAQPPQLSGTTDAGGHFIFTNLAAGRYQVRAQRDGYFGAAPPGSTANSLPTVISATATIDPSKPGPELAMNMIRGGTVSGRVRDPNGQPISGLQVFAYQIVYQNGRAAMQTLNSKQTDDRGDFRIFWLPPGDYYIGVLPRRTIGLAANPQDTFARTFFPGTIDPRTASAVKVTEASEITGIDVNIRGDATGKISGRVVSSIVGPTGQPQLAGSFFLLPSDTTMFSDAQGMNYPNASTNRTNGAFEIRGVLPGSYDLITAISDPTNGGQSIGRAHVEVGNGGSVEDVTLNVRTGQSVKAKLVLDTGAVSYTMQQPAARGGLTVINGVIQQAAATPLAPVPTPSIRLNFRSMEAYAPPFESAASQYTFDPTTNEFTFPNVPEGRYYLAVTSLPANSYIVDIRLDGRSVFDNGFVIAAPAGNLEVSVNSKGAKLQGLALDAAQKPVATARVVLVPEESRRQNQALYKSAASDANGNFTMSGIAPGQYKLFAWESVPGTAYMSPEFLSKYENQGQVVKILENATNNANAKVIH